MSEHSGIFFRSGWQWENSTLWIGIEETIQECLRAEICGNRVSTLLYHNLKTDICTFLTISQTQLIPTKKLRLHQWYWYYSSQRRYQPSLSSRLWTRSETIPLVVLLEVEEMTEILWSPLWHTTLFPKPQSRYLLCSTDTWQTFLQEQ